ncbi:MAG: RyR domain-containing protein [bacterium]|nr:RyR domain-containing protein [bacterium]
MRREYKPSPVDTSDVILPEELLELTEKIAENTHDVWATGRLKDGWSYGETRDDEKKTTPCLVSYDELPDSEKEYDRNTSLETIKLIIKLGYQITRRG